MNRLDAIQLVINHLIGDELIIHANGAISRESFFCKDRKNNFYLLGSMGLASSVGLGIALSQPDKKIIILDGDGNILMGFGNLALIGALKPKNFIHIILDNGVYGTTGNQPSISPQLELYKIALASGYTKSHLIKTPKEFMNAFPDSLNQSGTHFFHLKISKDVPQGCPRIPYSAPEIKKRFIEANS
jgi:thiamine pyrophosphate-dependent acetolactate synthase large subunit-like protein